MSVFLRILRYFLKYGGKAIRWIWQHRSTILNWAAAGETIDWIIKKIKGILHIR